MRTQVRGRALTPASIGSSYARNDFRRNLLVVKIRLNHDVVRICCHCLPQLQDAGTREFLDEKNQAQMRRRSFHGRE